MATKSTIKYDVNTDYKALAAEARAKGNEYAAKVYDNKDIAKSTGGGIAVSDKNVIRENEDRERYDNSDAGKADAIKRATQKTNKDYISSNYEGGFDAYYSTQQQKYDNALASGDTDMIKRIEADADRAGYTIMPTKNGANAYNANQGNAVAPVAPVQQGVVGGAVGGTQLNNIIDFASKSGQSYFDGQKSQLDIALQNQINELSKAYEQAVADGEISVRDAETQFNEQKKAIEQQAYLDKERTSAQGQAMGIQNSQQMLGLMQGDNARANGLKNSNQVEKDKRINDITDRLNAIRKQKGLDLANAKANYDSGILGAKANADKMVADNIFGLMKDDYAFNRQSNQDMNMFNLQSQQQMKILDKTQQNDLQKMSVNFDMDLQKMNLQQGFDMEKIQTTFNNELTAMAKQNGYAVQLEGMRQSGQLAQMQAQQKYQMDMLGAQMVAERQALERSYTPGTPEYKAAERDLELKSRQAANSIMSTNAANIWSEIVMNNPSLPAYGSEAKEEPYNWHNSIRTDLPDWQKPFGQAQGNIMNWITGYDKKQTEYEDEQNAIGMVGDYMNYGGINPMPWTADPTLSSYERFLKTLQSK